MIFFTLDIMGLTISLSFLGYVLIFLGYRGLVGLSEKLRKMERYIILGFFGSLVDTIPFDLETISYIYRFFLIGTQALFIFFDAMLIYHLIQGLKDIAGKCGDGWLSHQGEKEWKWCWYSRILYLIGLSGILLLNEGILIFLICMIVPLLIGQILLLIYIWKVYRTVRENWQNVPEWREEVPAVKKGHPFLWSGVGILMAAAYICGHIGSTYAFWPGTEPAYVCELFGIEGSDLRIPLYVDAYGQHILVEEAGISEEEKYQTKNDTQGKAQKELLIHLNQLLDTGTEEISSEEGKKATEKEDWSIKVHMNPIGLESYSVFLYEDLHLIQTSSGRFYKVEEEAVKEFMDYITREFYLESEFPFGY